MNWFKYSQNYFVSFDKGSNPGISQGCDNIIVWDFDNDTAQLNRVSKPKNIIQISPHIIDIPDKFSGYVDPCAKQCFILPPHRNISQPRKHTIPMIKQVINALMQAFGSAIKLVMNEQQSLSYADSLKDIK